MSQSLALIPAVALGWLSVATAVGGAETKIVEREVTERDLREASVRATQWNITPQEWIRYKELMRGARGIWTPGADPLITLGAHARNDEERRRFAELFVRKEYERVQGELNFQREVDAAWTQLFPAQPRLKRSTRISSASLLRSSPLRYAVVLEPGCGRCAAVLEQYIAQVEQNEQVQALDVYVRKTNGDDQRLRDWVTSNKVPVDLIRRNRLTVNHADQYPDGGVPAVWALQQDGKWQKLD